MQSVTKERQAHQKQNMHEMAIHAAGIVQEGLHMRNSQMWTLSQNGYSVCGGPPRINLLSPWQRHLGKRGPNKIEGNQTKDTREERNLKRGGGRRNNNIYTYIYIYIAYCCLMHYITCLYCFGGEHLARRTGGDQPERHGGAAQCLDVSIIMSCCVISIAMFMHVYFVVFV